LQNRLREIYRIGKQKEDMDWVAKEIEETVLSPLGLLKWKREEGNSIGH